MSLMSCSWAVVFGWDCDVWRCLAQLIRAVRVSERCEPRSARPAVTVALGDSRRGRADEAGLRSDPPCMNAGAPSRSGCPGYCGNVGPNAAIQAKLSSGRAPYGEMERFARKAAPLLAPHQS